MDHNTLPVSMLTAMTEFAVFGAPANAFQLKHQPDNSSIGLIANVVINAGTTEVTLNFTGNLLW